MCHTQSKKQKIIWTLRSIFVQAPAADFCKNTPNENFKKLNMQIGQLWSGVNN
jgi:hypothetical protein